MKQVRFVIAFIVCVAAAPSWADELQTAADQLSAQLHRAAPVKVAVLALPHHDNRPSEGPVLVSERLTTLLAREKNIAIVERSHIVQALSENGVSENGRLDPDLTKLIGEILGADVLVVGTLINLKNNKTEVNVRGIQADTGRVVAAARAMIDRTWAERPVLAW